MRLAIYNHLTVAMSGAKITRLDSCTKSNTPRFSLAGVRTVAKVVSVYDGDTITVAFDTLGLGYFLHNVRILGIDTPEIKGKTSEEKAAAIAARDWMRGLVDGQLVDLDIATIDKYGRLLANVMRKSDGLNLSQNMIETRHAVPYDGTARKPFVSDDGSILRPADD